MKGPLGRTRNFDAILDLQNYEASKTNICCTLLVWTLEIIELMLYKKVGK